MEATSSKPTGREFLQLEPLQVLKLCGGWRCLYLRICRILTKMADGLSHLRGGSYDHTVVQARGGTIRRDVPATRRVPGRFALCRRLTPAPTTRRSVVTSPSRDKFREDI